MLSAALFSLAGTGIAIGYAATRQLPFTLAACGALAAHLTYRLAVSSSLPIVPVVAVSVVLVAGFALAIDALVLRRLGSAGENWQVLAVSLGIFIVIQGAIALVFGESGRSFQIGRTVVQASATPRVTALQVAMVAAAVGVLLLYWLTERHTSIGRNLRGLDSNPDLCVVLGIDVIRLRFAAVSLAGGMVALATILNALDSGLVTSTGISVWLSGATAMIVGGVGSRRGTIIGAIVIAAAQHLTAYYSNPQWMDAAAYLILIAVLICKPLGFSGRRLKKVGV